MLNPYFRNEMFNVEIWLLSMRIYLTAIELVKRLTQSHVCEAVANLLIRVKHATSLINDYIQDSFLLFKSNDSYPFDSANNFEIPAFVEINNIVN